MKKLLLTLVALCALCSSFATDGQSPVAPMTSNAQAEASLIGKWVCDAKEMMGQKEAALQSCILTMDFSASAISMKLEMEGKQNNQGMSMEMGLRVTYKASYTRDGNTITVKPSKEKPVADLYKFELDKKTEDMLKIAGLTKETLQQSMTQTMANSTSLDHMETLQITQLTDTDLTLTDKKGQEMHFKRIK